MTLTLPSPISRFTVYYHRHGLRATVRRAVLAARRALFSSRAVVFYCDLSKLPRPPVDSPSAPTVHRVRSFGDIGSEDLQLIVHAWNPQVANQRMQERFGREASLWLIKRGDRLAGYGWTLQGAPIAPYYFPLTPEDVQFFDFYVFPKFRGRGIDWFLMTRVLQSVAADGAARAFAEAGEWNRASLSSIASTPFRRLGCVRKVTLLGQPIVFWARGDAVQPDNREAQSSRT